MKTNYLLCYDIASPRRLGRVFRYMRGRGVHLQYSVFYCSWTWPQLQEVKGKIGKIIHPAQDDVRIYPLPSEPRVLCLGLGLRVPEGVDIFWGASQSLDGKNNAQPNRQHLENNEEKEEVL
jgi:CRISPR-associated protein Cas2